MVQAPEKAIAALTGEGTLGWSGSRRALAGFFVSGSLMGFLGRFCFPGSSYLSAEYYAVALYFAGLIVRLGRVGVAFAAVARDPGRRLDPIARLRAGWDRIPVSGVRVTSSVDVVARRRMALVRGARRGFCTRNLSRGRRCTGTISGDRESRWDAVQLGCLADALLISGAYYLCTAPALQAWMAVIPAAFGWMYRKSAFSLEPVPHQPAPAAFLVTLRNPGAVLLSLLLFFQFSAIGPWLVGWRCSSVNGSGLVQRRPLWMLGLYWASLIVGGVAQWILPRVRHSWLLLGCVVLACSAGGAVGDQ